MVFGEWTQQQALRPRDHVYIRSGYSSPGPASCSQHTLLRVPRTQGGGKWPFSLFSPERSDADGLSLRHEHLLPGMSLDFVMKHCYGTSGLPGTVLRAF